MSSQQTISIYYSADKQFFVEVSERASKLNSDLNNLNDNDKQLLINVLQVKADVLADAIKGVTRPKDLVKQKILDYNKSLKEHAKSTWYIVADSLISKTSTPADITKLKLVSQHQGKLTNAQIFDIVAQKKGELSDKYAVFMCSNCGKKQFQPIADNAVQCSQCNSRFLADEIAVAKYDSADSQLNLLRAITRLSVFSSQVDGNTGNTSGNKLKMLRYFYYKGERYAFSYNDFLLLHKLLYKDCAYQSIFTVKDGSIAFCDNYRQYIEGFEIHKVKEVCQLYGNLNTIQSQLNSCEYGTNNIAVAFYVYIKLYCLGDITRLRCNIDGNAYCFDNVAQYVDTLLNTSDVRLRTQLIGLFCNLMTQEGLFFQGYDSCDSSELSRLIFDNSGAFVYVDGEQFVNYGTDFVQNLHSDVQTSEQKDRFLQTVMGNFNYWQNVKKKCNCQDNYDIEGSGCQYNAKFSAYDRLCFCQFVLTGKQQLNYKSVTLCDSAKGFEYVRQVVRRAYLSDNPQDKTQYANLAELLSKPYLCEHLLNLQSARLCLKDQQGNTVKEYSFAELCQHLDGKKPSTKLYLMCIDNDGIAKTVIQYTSRRATFVSHAFGLLCDETSQQTVNYADRLNKFCQDKDIAQYIQHLLTTSVTGGEDKFEQNCKSNFDKLVKALQQLRQ